jgi:type I restriction-modification system DNA methylase subunit/signal transduction histidine kinase
MMKTQNKTESVEISKQDLKVLSTEISKGTKETIDALDTLLIKYPANGILHQLRADFKSSAKDFIGAIKDYSEAIKVHPENADRYIGRGRCYESIGKKRKALEDYKVAFSIEDNEKTRKELFEGFLTNGFYKKAHQYYPGMTSIDHDYYIEELLAYKDYLTKIEQDNTALEILEVLLYNNRYDEYPPQEIQWEIDSIKEKQQSKKEAQIRLSVFRKPKELEDLFWKLSNEMKHKSGPLNGFLILAMLIFAKRQTDTNNDLLRESPFLTHNVAERFKIFIANMGQSATDTKWMNVSVGLDNPDHGDGSLEKSTKALQNTYPKLVKSLIKLLEEYDFSLTNIPVNVFGPAYDSFITNFSALGQNRRHEYISPKLVSNLITRKLVKGNNRNILDPAVGTGGFLLPTFNDRDAIKTESVQVYGYEVENHSYLLSVMNLISNGVYTPEIHNEDFFTGYPVMEDIDLAVCHPPFGKRIKPDGSLNTISPFPEYPVARIEFAFLKSMLAFLAEDGEYAIVVPMGILSDSGINRDFRKFLLKNDYVDAIVGLPERTMPNTSIKTAIIYGKRRSSPRSEPVVEFSVIEQNTSISATIDNALVDELWEGRDKIEVSIHDIFKLGVSLNPESYTAVKFATMLRLMEPGYPEQVMLDMVLKSTKSGPAGKIDRVGPGFPVPYIGLKDLFKDPWKEDLRIYPDWIDLKDQQKAFDVDPKFLIKESCILISLVGKELKPTVFRYDSTPIVVGREILALVPDFDRISLEYLLYELDNMAVLDQLQFARTATGISRLRISDLRKVVLKVPSIERQNYEINANRRFLYGNQRQVEESLRHDLEKVKQDFNSALRLIRHQLDGLIGGAKLYNSSLQMYFASKHPEILSEVIGDSQSEGGSEDNEVSVSRVMERLSGSLTQMGSELRIIKIITSGLENGPEKQLISLFDILESIKQEVDSESVTLHLPEQGRVLVQGLDTSKSLFADPEMIETAMRQLAENAIQHGQIKGKHLNIWFETKTGVPYKSTYCLQLIVRNDGKALPENFNLEMYRKLGEGAGESMNSGVGGNLVHRVLLAHEGEIIRMETLPNGQVEIEIMIPHPMEN